MITLGIAENALKQIYLDVVSHQLNTPDAFISKINHTSSEIYGKEILCPNFIEEDYKVLAKEELTDIYASIELSDKAIKVAQNSAGAFVDLLNDEMEGLIKTTGNHIIQAVYGEDVKPSYLPENEKYKPLILTGLKDIFDTEEETLYSIDRKKYNFYPQVKTINKLNVSEIEEIIDTLNPEVNFLICSPNVKRQIYDCFLNAKQNVETREQGDRLYYMMFNGNIVIQPFKYMSDNEIWLVNSEDFKLHQLCDWRWLEDENSKVLKQVLDKPVYKATLVKYCNLICHNVKGQIKIKIGE